MHLRLVTPSVWNKSSMWQVLLASLCQSEGCMWVIMGFVQHAKIIFHDGSNSDISVLDVL